MKFAKTWNRSTVISWYFFSTVLEGPHWSLHLTTQQKTEKEHALTWWSKWTTGPCVAFQYSALSDQNLPLHPTMWQRTTIKFLKFQVVWSYIRIDLVSLSCSNWRTLPFRRMIQSGRRMSALMSIKSWTGMMLELMYRTLRLSAGIGIQLLRWVDEVSLHVCECMRACIIPSALLRVYACIVHACVCLCILTIHICFRMIQKPCQDTFPVMFFKKMLYFDSFYMCNKRCVCASVLVLDIFPQIYIGM